MSDYDSPQVRSAIATVLRRYADDLLSGATRVIDSRFERFGTCVRFELMISEEPAKKAPERP